MRNGRGDDRSGCRKADKAGIRRPSVERQGDSFLRHSRTAPGSASGNKPRPGDRKFNRSGGRRDGPISLGCPWGYRGARIPAPQPPHGIPRSGARAHRTLLRNTADGAGPYRRSEGENLMRKILRVGLLAASLSGLVATMAPTPADATTVGDIVFRGVAVVGPHGIAYPLVDNSAPPPPLHLSTRKAAPFIHNSAVIETFGSTTCVGVVA